MDKQLVGTLNFTISFEFLTKQARQGWAEGRYQWAMDLLRDSGSPEKAHKHIIRGKLCMVTNEDGSGVVDADDWTPNLAMCSHGEYPDPDDIYRVAEKAQQWKRDLWRRLRIEYDDLERQRQRYNGTGNELWHVANHVRRFPEDFIDSLPDSEQELWKWAHLEDSRPFRLSTRLGGPPSPTDVASINAEIASELSLPARATDLDAFMEHEMELRERPSPPAGLPAEVETGWITPNGNVYPCGWNEHDWLAYRLEGGSTKEAEKLGWVCLGRSPMAQVLQATHLEDAPLTQRQLDTLFDWCQAHDVDMPEGLGEVK